MTDVVLECRDLSKEYSVGPQTLRVLDEVQLRLLRGERVAIVGSSGSGKTTLLNMLGGLDTPTSGEVRLAGQQLSTLKEAERGRLRNQELGFVYQFHHLLPEFTALENVMMPCALGGMAVSRSREKAASLLQRVGLAERLDHKPGELSGGERQRVAIARALVNEPDCVLMDEPTGNLDEHTGEGVQALIESLRDQLGIAFVMVTHDMKMARSLGRVMRLEQGRLIQEA